MERFPPAQEVALKRPPPSKWSLKGKYRNMV